jgi:hypothetical protein
MTTPLSPAAQAVLDAAFPVYDEDEHLYVATGEQHAGMIAAAAFRAAADQEKLGPDHWEGSRPDDYERGWNAALRNISRIAAELEANR